MATFSWLLIADGEPVGDVRQEFHCDLSAAEFASKAARMPRPFRVDEVHVWAGEDTAGEPLVRARRHPRRRALAVAS
jgi:hypothetical protein